MVKVHSLWPNKALGFPTIFAQQKTCVSYVSLAAIPAPCRLTSNPNPGGIDQLLLAISGNLWIPMGI